MDSGLLVLVVVAVIVVAVVVANSGKKGPTSSAPSSPRNTELTSASVKNPNTYRPSSAGPSHPSPSVQFRDKSQVPSTVSGDDLSGLVDALTGALLQPARGLYQCRRCKAFYQSDSFEVIRRENGSKCVSCGKTEIANVSGQREQRGANVSIGVVTLENYQEYVGRVATFEGLVCNVIASRSGRSYAVMFEPKSWVKGFKMVVFGDEVSRVGGAQFLLGLAGHRLRIRGLVTRHETFGYQVIVSDRAMILSIQ